MELRSPTWRFWRAGGLLTLPGAPRHPSLPLEGSRSSHSVPEPEVGGFRYLRPQLSVRLPAPRPPNLKSHPLPSLPLRQDPGVRTPGLTGWRSVGLPEAPEKTLSVRVSFFLPCSRAARGRNLGKSTENSSSPASVTPRPRPQGSARVPSPRLVASGPRGPAARCRRPSAPPAGAQPLDPRAEAESGAGWSPYLGRKYRRE